MGDGVSLEQYGSTYGITSEDEGLKLEFVKETQYGTNYGSRVYLMEDDDNYKLFRLKNLEFTMNVDMSRMPCGLNSAVYFVDIRRFYVQGGRVLPNSNSSISGLTGNSITDGICGDMKNKFGDINDFQRKGGLKAMGEALDRGMVLV